MKKRFTTPAWITDKKSLFYGIVIGAFAIALLWFVSANTQISISKNWHSSELLEILA